MKKQINKWKESETNTMLLYFNKKQGKEGGRKEGKKGRIMSVGWKTQHSMEKLSSFGTSLAVRWLRLHILMQRGVGSIPGQGPKSHLWHCLKLKKKKKA